MSAAKALAASIDSSLINLFRMQVRRHKATLHRLQSLHPGDRVLSRAISNCDKLEGSYTELLKEVEDATSVDR